MSTKPKPTRGLRHVALYIKDFSKCEHFYVELLGLRVEWRPDPDNIYLTSGTDSLALHRAPSDFAPEDQQRLDHIGFFLQEHEDVDSWHSYLVSQNVPIKRPPRDHRDGTRSFYCADPEGNLVQMIYYPIK